MLYKLPLYIKVDDYETKRQEIQLKLRAHTAVHTGNTILKHHEHLSRTITTTI